jgi:outer membrane immunogenic protein
MRWVICALVMLALPPGAFAADLSGDFDALRGSQPVGPARFTNWSGYYFGGQFSFGNMNTDFSNATQPLVAFSLRELTLENEQHPSTWTVLGKTSADHTGFGGFFGYNMQWQDVMLGLEANYTATNLTATAAQTPISRRTSAGGLPYDVTVLGTGSLHIADYATLRARAGWAMGSVMPYGFAGIAFGLGDYKLTSLVFGQESPSTPPTVPCDNVANPNCVDFSFANMHAQSLAILYGFSAGGGVDVAVTRNIFVRGEAEFIQFAPISHIVASIISARVGAGVKF